MIIILKKSNLVFLCTAVLFSLLAFHLAGNFQTVPASTIPAANKMIVLDAGHGAPDGGAVGKSGTLEKDVNLAICQKLQTLLEKSGASIVITRSDDNSIADDDKAKIREIKRSDLKNRRKYRDDSGADIFVSIHMNKFPEEQYKGAQVFYAKSPEGSKLLGETIQAELINLVDPQNTRVAKPADNSIYILKESTVPSVIVECGFLSNPEEEKLLATDAYQEKVAWGIYAGIQKYFEAQEKTAQENTNHTPLPEGGTPAPDVQNKNANA